MKKYLSCDSKMGFDVAEQTTEHLFLSGFLRYLTENRRELMQFSGYAETSRTPVVKLGGKFCKCSH
jgi:hypothetical protein